MQMTVLRYLCVYLATGLIFWLGDALWLGLVIKDFVLRELDGLLLASPQKLPAIFFYLLYVVAVTVFAVLPALDADSWVKALALGALLGVAAYATYDLSNLATLKNWSVRFAAVDICWGTVITATAAVGGFFISRALLARL